MAQTAKVKMPPDTLPADFKDFDKAPDTLPGNFFDSEESKPSAKPYNYASATAAPKPSWFQDAEADVRSGGGRTLVGRTLGRLQGSNKGYSGLGGVSEGIQNFMGSPLLGALHYGQGESEVWNGHPLKGAKDAALGLSEAATIPSMVMGGPGSRAAIEAVPSKKYAGKMFSELATDAANAGTKVKLNASASPLVRLLELGETGHSLPKGVTQLASESGDLPYQRARDFASTISKLSSEEKQAIRPQAMAELSRLRDAIHSDISEGLKPVLNGAERYAQALKEYRGASRLSDLGKQALGWGAKAAGAGAAYEGFQKLRRLL